MEILGTDFRRRGGGSPAKVHLVGGLAKFADLEVG
jgi:hypothetical protein